MDFGYDGTTFAPPAAGKPKLVKAPMEHSNSEERDQIDRPPVRQEEEPAPETGTSPETFQSDDWWRATPPASDWAEPVTGAAATDEPARTKRFGNGGCLFLRAYKSISVEPCNTSNRKGTPDRFAASVLGPGTQSMFSLGTARLFYPRLGTLIFIVRILRLFSPTWMWMVVDSARDQQKEDGTPFLLTLARNESIERQPAFELMRHYGQMLFSQLWSAPNVWIMFEKNAELLSGFGDVTGDPDVDDWSLETLRLVQNPDQPAGFDPASIPAFTREGFDRVQKLKLTSDEAQFGSQFNGARSVQQIAKNLRLDLKSARQLLFRFLALEIIECWPAGTSAKQEPKGGLGRLFRRGG